VTVPSIDVTSVARADVYKQGRQAGTLERTPDGVRFAYLPTWLKAGGIPVATSLPLSPDPVVRTGGALPAFFTGLLPEGRRLGALRRLVKTSADDELSLLLAIGADVVGDVQVVPAGSPPDEPPPLAVLDEHTGFRFADLLVELGIRWDRRGLPGVQEKVSAALVNVPVRHRGARYLLKLDPPEFRHLVANEAFFLRAARLTGLTTVEARVVHDTDGVAGLLVERFDRPPSPPGSRLAVEDACQVLGRPPADKYLISTEDAFGALAGLCQAPLPAALTLVRQLAFCYLSGNGDAHAKNFAVLQRPDGEWLPTPAYDLPSSQPYGDTTLAMSVNGRKSDLGGRDLLALGSSLRLPERAVRKALDDVCDRADLWLVDLDVLPFGRDTLTKLRRVVEHRRKRLRQ
jgi:serine/threonine-protein kinase HipA